MTSIVEEPRLASSPVVEPKATDLSAILPWYESPRYPGQGRGKAIERVREVLPRIAEAERAGYWPPGLSRAARAALRKQPAAEAFARANERSFDGYRADRAEGEGLLADVYYPRGAWHSAELRGDRLVRAMQFGNFDEAPALVVLADRLAPHVRGDAERAALVRARQWAVDFAPVAELVARLDATRPRPSYAFGEISQVVLQNVQGVMGVRFETVRFPEVKWELVQYNHPKTGRIAWTWVGVILWPPGTRHGTSRFGVSASGAQQCQACGHAIRDGGNWCPLVLDGPGGPASLWVGRDCARHLFGCRVTGDGSYRERP